MELTFTAELQRSGSFRREIKQVAQRLINILPPALLQIGIIRFLLISLFTDSFYRLGAKHETTGQSLLAVGRLFLNFQH